MSMEIAAQIWGLPSGRPLTFADIAEKLDMLLSHGGLKRIICGWTLKEPLFREIKEYVAPHGVQVFLWFPVFSELEGIRPFSPLVDFKGQTLHTPAVGTPEEFRFRCPCAPKNIDYLMDIFERSYAHLPLDGVFLDRVRYPSFFSGPEGVFSCFCPCCRAFYEAAGLSIPDLKEAWQQVLARAGRLDPNPLTLCGYSEKGYIFEDQTLQRFFECKSEILTQSVNRLTVWFRKKGLSVGMDLFTPSLGYFAGQVYLKLLPLADFVKPMLYRYTNAPAGLPYELNAYDASFGLHGKGAQALLYQIGAKEDDEFASMVRQEMMQMHAAKKACSSDALILPGMEINRVEPIAPITPEKVLKSVSLLKQCGAEGIAASWNLADTPTENLKAFLDNC
jgi:hypothetical protein